MDVIQVKLAKKYGAALDIAAFEFVPADGGELPPFTAGDHIDVHLPTGLVRQYSIYGDPQDNSAYRLAVLKDPESRGGSLAMHDLEEGQIVTVSTPRNAFRLVEDAPKTILIAGGIGITPVLSMAHRLAALDKPFELHYSTRSPERTAFLDLLKTGPLSANTVIYHNDSSAMDPSRVFAAQPKGTHVYVCGPSGFIDWVLKEAQAADVPQSQLHREFFAKPETTIEGDAFEVVLQRSGKTVVIPAGESVTETLAKACVDIPVSCEMGVCGTCITKVLEGTPDHRDSYLSDEEKEANDRFMPCCSRAQSKRLVLDL